MRMRVNLVCKVAYTALGLSMLVFFLSMYSLEEKNDLGILLGYCALLLAFPISIAVLALLGFIVLPISEWLAISIQFGYLYIIASIEFRVDYAALATRLSLRGY